MLEDIVKEFCENRLWGGMVRLCF